MRTELPESLKSVLANDEFVRRPLRRPDYDSDSTALSDLAQELATSPARVLQKLTDTALQLCDAQSAGISLLEEENGRKIFRWHAVSGRWASYLWATMPREFSPCGTVLDLAATQLMIRPERHFTPIKQMSPQISEVLLIPFRVSGEIVGTLWVIAHDDSRKFDLEDRRVVSNLAAFAAKAYERIRNIQTNVLLRPLVLGASPQPASGTGTDPLYAQCILRAVALAGGWNELGDLLNVPTILLHSWAEGRSQISLTVLYRIADLLHDDEMAHLARSFERDGDASSKSSI